MIRSSSTSLLALAFLAACSSGNSTLTPAANVTAESLARGKTSVRITIKVPRRKHGAHSHYISPSTQSIELKVYDATHTNLLALLDQNLTPTSHGCQIVSGNTLCALTISVRPGAVTLDATTYDLTGETGTALSALSDFPFTVKRGAANDVPLTLGGLATSIVIVPPNVPAVTGTQATGFSIFGNSPVAFTIKPEDADGNTIIGPGAPQVGLNPAPADMTVASPAPGSLTWTFTSAFAATNPVTGATTSISAVATPVPNSGGVTVSANPPVSLNQNWFYVSDCANKVVHVFDDAGNAKSISGLAGLAGNTSGLAYDSHNGFLYVTENAPPYVKAVDPVGNAQTLSGSFTGTTSSTTGILFDPHNDELYVAVNAGAMRVYTEQGAAVSVGGTFPNLFQPYQMAFDPNNDLIYVANYGGGTDSPGITVYDEQGNAQSITFAGTSGPEGITYDSHNGLFYVANITPAAGVAPVTVYDASGNEQVVSGTWAKAADPSSVTFDPHTNRIYVTNFNFSSGSTPAVTAYDEQGNQVSTTGCSVTGSNGPLPQTIVAIP